MAVGRTGGFATTQAPIVDFAGMIRDAQQKQSELIQRKGQYAKEYQDQIKELEESAGYQIGADGKIKSILEPDPQMGNYAHSDVIVGGLLKEAQDLEYEFAKQLEGQNFESGKSIGELRGKRNALNKSLERLNNDLKVLQNADNILSKKVLSQGIDTDTYNTFKYLSSGKNVTGYIFDKETFDSYVEVEENGEKRKISIGKTAEWVANAPIDLELSKNVTALSDEFVAQIKQDTKNFTTTLTEGLVNSHKEEMRDWAEKQVLDRNKFNSSVYEAFDVPGIFNVDQFKALLGKTILNAGENEGLLPEKLRGIQPKDITDALAYEVLTDELSEKVIRNVQNRVNNKTEKTIDYGARQRAIDAKNKADKEKKTPPTLSIGDVDPNFYEDIIDIGAGVPKTSRGQQMNITSDQLKGKKEVRLSTPLVLDEITGYNKGETKTIQKPSIKSYVKLDDGGLAVRLSYQKEVSVSAEQPTVTTKAEISKKSEQTTKQEGQRQQQKFQGATQTSMYLNPDDAQAFLSANNLEFSEASSQGTQNTGGASRFNK